MMKNVFEVDHRGLCLECGACVGLCPHHNVLQEQDEHGRYRIRISDATTCTSCSQVCLKVCPGHTVNVDDLNLQVFGSLPADYLGGNYRAAYLGYASDPQVRFLAASGGIISGLLIHAVGTGRIRGAHLVHDVTGKPFSPSFDLAADRCAILSAAGSKYWPAPVARSLGQILRTEGKFAFVGLPCEIQALRKAQALFKPLQQKIAFSIGLFCGSRPTIQGQCFALRKYGCDPAQVAGVRYRAGDWPGQLVIDMQDGRSIKIPRSQQLPGFTSHLVPHPRCLLCHDSLADLSDIAVGDAWRLEDLRQETETSLVVARTTVGQELIDSAVAAAVLYLRPVGIEAVIHSQQRPLLHKRRALWARLRIAKTLGWNTPEITLSRPEKFDPTPGDYWAGTVTLLAGRLVQADLVLAILLRLPLSWLQRRDNFKRLG